MRLDRERIKHILDRWWPTDSEAEAESAERVWANIEEELKKHDTSLRSLYGDGWSAPALKQHEFQILTATAMLGGQGTVRKICDLATNWAGELEPYPVWLALHNLGLRGLVTVHEFFPEPGAPGQSRYHVTEDGERALSRARAEGKQLANPREAVLEPGCTQ